MAQRGNRLMISELARAPVKKTFTSTGSVHEVGAAYSIPLFELEAGLEPATSLTLLNPVIECGLNPEYGSGTPRGTTSSRIRSSAVSVHHLLTLLFLSCKPRSSSASTR
jgi:hypothetical protein